MLSCSDLRKILKSRARIKEIATRRSGAPEHCISLSSVCRTKGDLSGKDQTRLNSSCIAYRVCLLLCEACSAALIVGRRE